MLSNDGSRRYWSKDITTDDLIDEFAPFVDRLGYRFSTDTQKVNVLLDKIIEIIKEEGDAFCPCRPRVDNPLEDRDLVCPCISVNREEFARIGKCYCGLFDKFDAIESEGLTTAYARGEEVEVPVMLMDDMPDNTVRQVEIGGRKIALVRLGEEIFALSGICLHMGAPLGEGYLDGRYLICPLHGWRYDVINATTNHPDANVKNFETEIRDGVILLKMHG